MRSETIIRYIYGNKILYFFNYYLIKFKLLTAGPEGPGAPTSPSLPGAPYKG